MQNDINFGDVRGLPAIEYEMLRQLAEVYNSHYGKNNTKDRYYEGKISLSEVNLGIALPDGMKKLGAFIKYALWYDEDLFKDLTITKSLSPYDKMIYTFCAALFEAGNHIITTRQLYRLLTGSEDRPSIDQRQKIDDAITKLNAAHIYVDNIGETNANYKYPHFKYDGSLLPMERIRAEINGDLVESAIHLLREPPLFSFARSRKQITQLSVEVFQIPMKKTEDHFFIHEILLEYIIRINKGKRNEKILYSTLYEDLKIKPTERVKKSRAEKKVWKLLDHYTTKKLIQGYTLEENGIIIKPQQNKKQHVTKQ